jgi:hypothetical protein
METERKYDTMFRITLLCKKRKSTAITSGVDKLQLVRRIQGTTVRISEVHTIYDILHRSAIAVKKPDYKFRTLEGDRICDTILTIRTDDTSTRTPPVEYRAVNLVSQLFPAKPITTDLTGKRNMLLVG